MADICINCQDTIDDWERIGDGELDDLCSDCYNEQEVDEEVKELKKEHGKNWHKFVMKNS